MTTRGAASPGPSAKSIVVVGSLNMDLVLRVSRAPAAGETLMGRQFSVVPGGKGANQAVACARLGAPVTLIGSLGADAFGAQLRQAMAGDGIDTTHVVTDDRSATGVAMIQVDDDGQNRIVVVSGANATLEPIHVDAASAAIDRAALMILQLEVPLATVEHAVDRAVRAGLPVLLNPAPVLALPDRLWPKIDYLIPNESEASALAGIPVTDPSSAMEAAWILRSRGVRHVLVTLGRQGVVIVGPDDARHLAARSVQAVDTTAAGDTFIGGVAVGLREGMTLWEAADLGQRAAALCVTRHGAQPAIPFRAEL
ncbi:ribokinase [Telmatospirillum siberiense]|uniref:Ribokinase n=1 Tax=Telmatospirillum siberiense TaxID=382514 RepID=A0A2N3PQX8_9PROT|nr:ribokinase [Telmatospirillum siberiense]PKU22807.1 ribokinase [Telmatospirillum siberiense]